LNRPPKDPWGFDYHYQRPGERNPNSYDLSSLGADGQSGGGGENQDIGNWE
jgi:general secretion pathway protein G